MEDQITVKPRGRPGKFAKYEQLLESLPPLMTKRPKYRDGIGLFRGQRGITAWVKIRLPRGGYHNGKAIDAGDSVEIKLGKLGSWEWRSLEAERDRLQGKADRGEPLQEALARTFGEVAADWLARKKDENAKSYVVIKGIVDNHLIPQFGGHRLSDISPSAINKWVADQRRNCQPATVKRRLGTLSTILNESARAGELKDNPIKQVNPIRGIEARQRFLDAGEMQTVLDAALRIEKEQDDRAELMPHEKRGWLKDFVLWAAYSGMRRQEILNLVWDDVKRFDDGTAGVQVVRTKNDTGRFIHATKSMIEILERLKALPRDEGDSRLFPVSLTTAKRLLTRLWKECGLNDVRLHDIRRSHATHLVRRGIDVRTVAGRLGHRGTDMLAKHYAMFTGDKLAAESAEDLFS
jgi:integrase